MLQKKERLRGRLSRSPRCESAAPSKLLLEGDRDDDETKTTLTKTTTTNETTLLYTCTDRVNHNTDASPRTDKRAAQARELVRGTDSKFKTRVPYGKGQLPRDLESVLESQYQLILCVVRK